MIKSIQCEHYSHWIGSLRTDEDCWNGLAGRRFPPWHIYQNHGQADRAPSAQQGVLSLNKSFWLLHKQVLGMEAHISSQLLMPQSAVNLVDLRQPCWGEKWLPWLYEAVEERRISANIVFNKHTHHLNTYNLLSKCKLYTRWGYIFFIIYNKTGWN